MQLPPDAMGSELLQTVLHEVELQLENLGQALRERDTDALDLSAAQLQSALARAVHLFGAAAATGRVPEPLRLRLARAGGQVAAHRESLARATAALDRAIDVLLPQARPSGAYGGHGRLDRPSLGGLSA